MIKMEKGNYYVMSLRKLAKFICNDMNIGDIYTFATGWDEDEFIMEADYFDVSDWFGFQKIPAPFDSREVLLLIGHYGGGDYYLFEVTDDYVAVADNLKDYITNYTQGTTITGYVCFDPENQKKEKEEE